MVIPDAENPGPVKKRPRLSLKGRKTPTSSCTSVVEEKDSRSDVSATPSKSDDMDIQGSVASETSALETIVSDSSEEAMDEQDTRVPSVSSLENFGNTCFMNSVMQVLRYTPKFLDNLAQLFQEIVTADKLKRKHKDPDGEILATDETSKKCWKVVRNVYRVYKNMAALEGSYDEVASDDVMSMSIKPDKVLSAIRDLNAMYEGSLQHDAQEFLRCLLGYLQDAEREVQKFYSSYTPSLQQKVAVLDPIMKRFLSLPVKTEEPSDQQTNAAMLEPIVKGVLEPPTVEEEQETHAGCRSGAATETRSTAGPEAVKVNLFPKQEAAMERSEAVKSPSKIVVTPQLGDTAGVVDEKSIAPLPVKSECCTSDSTPKVDTPEKMKIELNSKVNSIVADSAAPGKGARRGRRSRPCVVGDTGSSQTLKVNESENDACLKSIEGKHEKTISDQVSFKRKIGRQKKNEKFEMTIDKSQPSIDSVFGKTYSTQRKRLGVRRIASLKESSLCNTEQCPAVSSVPSDNEVSLLEAERQEMMECETISEDSVPLSNGSVTSVNEPGTDKTLPVADDMPPEAEEGGVPSMLLSWQETFKSFVGSADTDRDSSVMLISDSDSDEDIVQEKKIAKQIHESPRRSPRKVLSSVSCSVTPGKLSDLCSSIMYGSTVEETSLIRECKELDPQMSVASTSLEAGERQPQPDTASNTETNTNSNAVEAVTMATSPSKQSQESPLNLCNNKVPLIKLEKCDYVFNKNGKFVSANYAEKCLSPTKSSPLKSLSSVASAKRNVFKGSDLEVQKGLNKALREFYNSPVKEKKEMMEGLFQGTMLLRTRCLQCEASKERREDFHDVSVPVRYEKNDSDEEDDDGEDGSSSSGLMRLIEASMEVEKLLEDNKYYCDDCKCYVEAERSIHYDVMPDILTIHLKRFSMGSGQFGFISKITDHVEIPMSLPCLRYRCPKPCRRPEHRYTLYGLVTHTGVTLSSGHYLAYVRAAPIKPSDEAPVPQSLVKPEQELEPSQPLAQDTQTDMSTSSEKLPLTRRKAGVSTKLPSRFDSNVVTNTKVKAFGSLVPPKPTTKPSLSECLQTCQQFSNQWFECDDETVRVFTDEEFKDLLLGRDGALLGSPYLLFYHKATLC